MTIFSKGALAPQRLPGEPYELYCQRRAVMNKMVRRYRPEQPQPSNSASNAGREALPFRHKEIAIAVHWALS